MSKTRLLFWLVFSHMIPRVLPAIPTGSWLLSMYQAICRVSIQSNISTPFPSVFPSQFINQFIQLKNVMRRLHASTACHSTGNHHRSIPIASVAHDFTISSPYFPLFQASTQLFSSPENLSIIRFPSGYLPIFDLEYHIVLCKAFCRCIMGNSNHCSVLKGEKTVI